MSDSRWIEFDQVTGEFTYEYTEDYVFARGSPIEKRIGDMDRSEMIHVICTLFHDREQLAKALWDIIGEKPDAAIYANPGTIDLAQKIVERCLE